VNGHRFRVTRTPRYERPKSRGTGTTISPATASLSWVGGTPRGRALGGTDRIPEVGLIVAELLGMTADQFFQVVLLPQGEFARFLRADTDQREQLLERLFDTRRFGRVEDWFADTRRAGAAALREVGERSRRLAARLAQAAGWRGEVPDLPDTGWLQGIRELVAARRDLSADERDAAAEVRQTSLDEARRLGIVARRADELRRLWTSHRDVTAAEPDRLRWRHQIAAARRAEPVLAAAAAAGRARIQLDDERRSRAALISGLRARLQPAAARPAVQETPQQTLARDQPGKVAPGSHLDGDLLPATAAELRKPARASLAAAATRERIGELAGLADLGTRNDHDRLSLEGLRKSLAATELQRAELDAESAALPAVIDLLADETAHAAATAATLGAAKESRDQLASLLAAARRVPAVTETVRVAADKVRAATDRAQSATDVRLALTERRLANMAGELARGLSEGDPCPVCGAEEHPQPASGDATPVSQQDLATAQRAEKKAVADRDDAVQARAVAEQELAVLVAALDGRSLDEVETDHRAADTAVGRASAATAALPKLQTRLRDERFRLEQLETRRSELAVAVSTMNAQILPLEAAIAERTARLAAAAHGYESLAHRRRVLGELASALDEIGLAGHRVAGARKASVAADAAFVAALHRSEFGSLDEVRVAAAVDADELRVLLQRADTAAAALEAQLALPENAHLFPAAEDHAEDESPSDNHPDAAALQLAADHADAAARKAERAYTEAFSHAASAAARASDVEAVAADLRASWAGMAPMLAQDRELAALTDVILGRGANRLQMSLRSYVLAAWLREVAVAANARLRVLTAGRYSFVHTTGKEARGRSGGLGLDVLDEYSGKPRPAKTLSGGESFLASLALALGLADVVAGRSGAGLLHTLFIDEGFGSLDAESLDLVMDTLDTLRGEGRVVGVVSHVDELRQRIPSRLRVHRRASGSTIELSTSTEQSAQFATTFSAAARAHSDRPPAGAHSDRPPARERSRRILEAG
jgi:DNA repair protein SbcC/Rad50